MATKRTKSKKPQELMLHVLSNEPTHQKYDILEMFLRGAIQNTIGYMDALNQETGQEEQLLVGLQGNAEGKFDVFPLARILGAAEVTKYLAPDGTGAWSAKDPTTATVFDQAV